MYGMSAKDRLAYFQNKAAGETKKGAAPAKKVGKLGTSAAKKSTKTDTKSTTSNSTKDSKTTTTTVKEETKETVVEVEKDGIVEASKAEKTESKVVDTKTKKDDGKVEGAKEKPPTGKDQDESKETKVKTVETTKDGKVVVETVKTETTTTKQDGAKVSVTKTSSEKSVTKQTKIAAKDGSSAGGSKGKSLLTASNVYTGAESDLDLDSELEANYELVSDVEAITPMIEAQKTFDSKKKKATEKQEPPKATTAKEEAKPAPNEVEALKVEHHQEEPHEIQELEATAKSEIPSVSVDAAALISLETREQVIIEDVTQPEKEAVVKIASVSDNAEELEFSTGKTAEFRITTSPQDAETEPAEFTIQLDEVTDVAVESSEKLSSTDVDKSKVEQIKVEKVKTEEPEVGEIKIEETQETKDEEELVEEPKVEENVVEADASNTKEFEEIPEVTEEVIPTPEAGPINAYAENLAQLIITSGTEPTLELVCKNQEAERIADSDDEIRVDEVAEEIQQKEMAPVEEAEIKADKKEEAIKVDEDVPLSPKTVEYKPLPDEFYDTIFYFSGMGKLIGSALAQGVYVNSKTAKSALDIRDIEKLDAPKKEQTKKEDLLRTARMQAQDLALDVQHLQSLLDGLPSFTDPGQGSESVHLVFKKPERSVKVRSRSQPPLMQTETRLPWEKDRSQPVYSEVTVSNSAVYPKRPGEKVPVMPGMPQYIATQNLQVQKEARKPGVARAPQQAVLIESAVVTPIDHAPQVKVASTVVEAEESLIEPVDKQINAEKITPVEQMKTERAVQHFPGDATDSGPKMGATPPEMPNKFSASPLSPPDTTPSFTKLEPFVANHQYAESPVNNIPPKPAVYSQITSVKEYSGGPLAPRASQPKQGGARQFGVQTDDIKLESKPWQGRVGARSEVRNFSLPKPFLSSPVEEKKPVLVPVQPPTQARVAQHSPVEVPKFTPPRPFVAPLSPVEAEPSPSVVHLQAKFQKRPAHKPGARRATSQQPTSVSVSSFAPEKNGMTDFISTRKIETSGLKSWQLSHIRALEAKGILVSDKTEYTPENVHRLPRKSKPQTMETSYKIVTSNTPSSTTIRTSSSFSSRAQPTFYAPKEQRAIRSVPFDPLASQKNFVPRQTAVGFSDL